jgi:hypothetical protein
MAKFQVSFSGVDTLGRKVLGVYTVNTKTQIEALNNFFKWVVDKVDIKQEVGHRTRVSHEGSLISFPIKRYHLKGRKRLTGSILMWAKDGESWSQIEPMIKEGVCLGETDHCFDKPFQDLLSL